MKKCPTCNRTFADDTLSFCLDDGALLSAAYDPDKTLVMSDIPTVAKVNQQTRKRQRDQPRASNSLVTFLLIALIALLLGGGIVGVLFYRSSNPNGTGITNSTETPREKESKPSNVQIPIPAATPTPRFTIQDALRTYDYEQGWSGGRANNEYSPNISYYPVTNTNVNGDDVVMYYAWKDGVIRGTISGNDLKGTWHQSNGNGPITLRFTDDFQSAKGTWSDGSTGESGTAVLRRRR